MLEIREADPFDTDVREMIADLDAYQLAIYPAESSHLDALDELVKPNVRFVGAYHEQELVGIGAVKFMTGDCEYGEIKRVWVSQSARGMGVSKCIMDDLEQAALERGVTVIRLETGVHQPEALGLYEKLGYRRRDRYGAYPDDPLSVFMEKMLA